MNIGDSMTQTDELVLKLNCAFCGERATVSHRCKPENVAKLKKLAAVVAKSVTLDLFQLTGDIEVPEGFEMKKVDVKAALDNFAVNHKLISCPTGNSDKPCCVASKEFFDYFVGVLTGLGVKVTNEQAPNA